MSTRGDRRTFRNEDLILNKYFNELRKRNLIGFVSAIDVAMRKAAGEKE